MSSRVTVTRTVSIREFSTDALVQELYNRIYDSIHDEEPQNDEVLNDRTEINKRYIMEALNELL